MVQIYLKLAPKKLQPDCDIKFSTERISQKELNYIYNIKRLYN